MENVTHSIKIVFAVIVFCMALSITFTLFNKLKITEDAVFYAKDENLYYEIKDYEKENPILKQKRKVGLETVISNILNYADSNNIIYLRKGSYNENTSEITNIQNIKVYTSNISEEINFFDIEEEIKKGEYWVTSKQDINNHIMLLLYGGTYNDIEYLGLLNTELKGNVKFIEEIGKKEINGKERTLIYYTII